MTKRAIFEDVGTATREEVAPVRRRQTREWRRGIAVWLWALAALVVVMIVVGGLTRLTDSGLSITEWDPVMGAVPPLSQADWLAAFEAYKTTTEFQEQNHWMTLADFKPIYWWEWGHRQFGRLIGIVWLLGFLVFLTARAIPSGWTGRLILPGLLGGIQGAIGWWMVVSGLDRLDVSSVRLAIHLCLAFVILMLLSWYAHKVRLAPVDLLQARRRRLRGPGIWAGLTLTLTFLQIGVGALVSGIDAGRYYVDWPLMGGEVFPADALALEPWWRNLTESPGLVQFVHRILGYGVALVGLAMAVACLRSGPGETRGRGLLAFAMILVQIGLGVVTVMNAAPLHWAILHQGGAILLVLLLLRARFSALYPTAQSIRG